MFVYVSSPSIRSLWLLLYPFFYSPSQYPFPNSKKQGRHALLRPSIFEVLPALVCELLSRISTAVTRQIYFLVHSLKTQPSDQVSTILKHYERDAMPFEQKHRQTPTSHQQRRDDWNRTLLRTVQHQWGAVSGVKDGIKSMCLSLILRFNKFAHSVVLRPYPTLRRSPLTTNPHGNQYNKEH